MSDIPHMPVGMNLRESILRWHTPEFMIEASKREHRLNGYLTVLRSDDYIWVRCCISEEQMPQGPNPYDLQITKRPWEKAMQNWRKEIQKKKREIIEATTSSDVLYQWSRHKLSVHGLHAYTMMASGCAMDVNVSGCAMDANQSENDDEWMSHGRECEWVCYGC